MGETKPRLKTGLVVLFEGVDGVGKTTQLQLVDKDLAGLGHDVHTTRNLGGTPIGEELREVAFSPAERLPETDLYISAAIQSELAESIRVERSKGKVVLVDRGPLSLAAYHIYGNGVDATLGWQFADEGMAKFKPDLVILYEMDLEDALERANQRKGHVDYYASKPKRYFQQVEKGYKTAAARYKTRIVRIDASKSIEDVHARTMDAIDQTLKHKH